MRISCKMGRILSVLIIGSSLSLFAHSATSADEVVSLVKKIITVSGGKAAVEGMTSVHASADVEAFKRGDRGRYELLPGDPENFAAQNSYVCPWQSPFLCTVATGETCMVILICTFLPACYNGNDIS